MSRTDGTQDDLYGVDTPSPSLDDEFAPPRRRRSTYTPPPQYREPEPAVPAADLEQPVAQPAPVSAAPQHVAPAPIAPAPVAAEPIAAQPVAAEPVASAPVTPEPVAPAAVTPAAVAPAPAASAPVVPEPVVPAPDPVAPEPARPSYAVYSIDDGSLDAGPDEPATTSIPDWSSSAWSAPVAPPVVQSAQPLAPPPAWTPAPPVAPPVDRPAEAPVEPNSPYRAWTPDSHVDADAYWNTARRADVDRDVAAAASQSVVTPNEPESVDSQPLASAPVWSLDDDEPARDRYRPWVPEPQPETTPLWDALFPTTPPVAYGTPVDAPPTATPAPESAPVDLHPADAPVSVPAASVPTASVPTASVPTASVPPAPAEPAVEAAGPATSGYMSPDDEAATLASHAPPAGQPWIPQRRSLPDDLLVSVLEAADSKPGGTLDAMDALENEMRLREEEVQEYREWEDSMLAVGTPEALAVVAQVRPEFTAITIPVELEPTPTQAIPIQYPAEPSDGRDETPWPFSEPGEPEVPLLPQPPVSPDTTPEFRAPAPPAEPALPSVPEQPAEPTRPVEPGLPVEPEHPTEPARPAEPEGDEVSHDMPQSWFDALLAPTGESAQITETPQLSGSAQATGYPAPRFDELVASDEAPDDTSSPAADPVPPSTEGKPKRPFGVAVADGEPREDIVDPPVARPRTPVFTLELSGDRPTARDLRTGRASRMFWLWFAANSSVVSLALGALVFSLGMSLRQSIVAALAGVGLSLVPLGLGTLAGKRSGQPTMIVSRAVFGLVGNVAPAVLALVSRVFWGAVLLWLFATSVSSVVASGGGSTAGLVVVFIVVGVMVAGLVAFVGYWLLARVQLVVSIVSAALIVGFVALTWRYVDVQAALTVDDGPWLLVLSGAVVVFSFLGLVWANSASDLARYQNPSASSGATMLWSGFGATVPSFLLVGYGALLAASDRTFGATLVTDPVAALSGILPDWYPVPLVVATGLSLLSGVVITVYSGSFALQSMGVRVERQWGTLFVGALLAVVAVGFSIVELDLAVVFRDLATTLAVPVAAWAGMFAADTMIRNRPFHTASLLRIGGVYPTVNWINLSALAVVSIVGWGLTTASLGALGWQGYLFRVASVDLTGTLATSDVGVLVALVLGLATPLVSGIPAIRRQEADSRPI